MENSAEVGTEAARACYKQ